VGAEIVGLVLLSSSVEVPSTSAASNHRQRHCGGMLSGLVMPYSMAMQSKLPAVATAVSSCISWVLDQSWFPGETACHMPPLSP
jgi:hypothetical protein